MREEKQSKYQKKTETFSGARFEFPLDNLQKDIVSSMYHNQISILTGDPGTSKTYMMCHFALKQLTHRAVSKIIISKSPVETGKGIGFLPGEIDDKLAPFKDSYIDILNKIAGEPYIRYCIEKKLITFEPMGFVRGKSFEDSVIILDEAQNCSIQELMSFSSRICENSKMLFGGDFYQIDIKNSGLKDFINICGGIESINYTTLGSEFQKRSKIITDMFNNYKKFIDNDPLWKKQLS